MRRFTVLLLSVLLLLGLCSCSAAPVEDPTPSTSTLPSSGPETQSTQAPETTVPEETEPVLTGELLLNVSKIDLSLVGDSENIYIGTAPLEQITWHSADESIVTVENGFITATGVGTTIVTALHGDNRMECTVGCLAASEEELSALPDEVLRAPKRLPAVIENPPLELYSDAAIIGDSISYILFQYETMHGIMGHPLFLVRGGTGLNGLVLRYKNISYQGQEMYIEDAVAASNSKKIFIMLGQNDLGYRTVEESMSSWEILTERILEKVPDAQFYIQSCIYEWFPTHESIPKNKKIDEYNSQLIQYAEDNGYHYIDIQKYVEDHTGRLATAYSLDKGIHMNEDGCITWMNALNLYMYLQSIGGTHL